jgi:hypothetical protein
MDMATHDRCLVLDLADREDGCILEQLRQRASRIPTAVLNEHERQREPGREPAHQRRQRLQSSPRRADHDDTQLGHYRTFR